MNAARTSRVPQTHARSTTPAFSDDGGANETEESIPPEVLETLPVGEFEAEYLNGEICATLPLPVKRFSYKLENGVQFEITVPGGDDISFRTLNPPKRARRPVRARAIAPPGGAASADTDEPAKKVTTCIDVDNFLRPHASLRVMGRPRPMARDIGVYGAHGNAPGTEILRSFGAEKAPTPRALGVGSGAAREVIRSVLGQQEEGANCPRVRAVNAPSFFDSSPFLDQGSREALKARVDALYAVNRTADTVTSLSVEELTGLIGPDQFSALRAVFDSPVDRVKLRRVSADDARDVIKFHLDVAAKTMRVSLNDGQEYEGSRLLYATDAGFMQAPVTAGSASVHDRTVPHGVTALTAGVRYGLFLLANMPLLDS